MNSYLKNKRVKLGLTQVEVSKKVGIAERTYQYIEAGERIPNVYISILIAKALDSTVEELFENYLLSQYLNNPSELIL